MVRYCDDFVVCFQSERDAGMFLDALRKRLAEFGLQLSEEKTQVIRFGRGAERNCHKEGHKRPQTFNFLGFTHYVTRSRSGRFKVGRKTERKRLSNKLAELNARLSYMRREGGKAMMDYVILHLRGHCQYYGVSDNIRSIRRYYLAVCRSLFKWLNRRSQRRSVRWDKYEDIISRELPKPRIVHGFYPLYA
jgi:RNA-directed DNA polymerase